MLATVVICTWYPIMTSRSKTSAAVANPFHALTTVRIASVREGLFVAGSLEIPLLFVSLLDRVQFVRDAIH